MRRHAEASCTVAHQPQELWAGAPGSAGTITVSISSVADVLVFDSGMYSSPGIELWGCDCGLETRRNGEYELLCHLLAQLVCKVKRSSESATDTERRRRLLTMGQRASGQAEARQLLSDIDGSQSP